MMDVDYGYTPGPDDGYVDIENEEDDEKEGTDADAGQDGIDIHDAYVDAFLVVRIFYYYTNGLRLIIT